MTRYTHVEERERGFKRKDKDQRFTCMKCGSIATVRAFNATHLKLRVHYCRTHAEEGGVV